MIKFGALLQLACGDDHRRKLKQKPEIKNDLIWQVAAAA